MITTKAAITDGKGRFYIDTITVSDPGADEVLVKIKASGICHTDYDSISWGRNLVMGHEGAGVVVKVGANVSSVKAGDHVVLNWAIPCGTCFQCSLGNTHICEENSFCTGKGKGHAHPQACQLNGQSIPRSFHLGTMSGYTVVKEKAAVPIIFPMSFSSACIIGCGVMTGYGSAVKAARVQPGSSCAVIGCGGVGLNVIQGCKISGASQIIAIDINETRLKVAAEFGATEFILASKDDIDLTRVKSQVKNLTHDRGADYAFECTAIPELGAAPLALIRNAGTAVQVSGIEKKILFDCELFEWNKIYINPLYGNSDPQVDFPRIMDLYRQGTLKLDELVSKSYKLEQIAEAFEDMHSRKISKGVIIFED